MRESRLSGSVEGVLGNHDSYSDCLGFWIFESSCLTRRPAAVNQDGFAGDERGRGRR
jgi:hypothetical protein